MTDNKIATPTSNENNKVRSAEELATNKFANLIETIGKNLAFIVSIVLWTIIGGIFWVIAIIIATIVIMCRMMFKLLASRKVDAEARSFQTIIQFWPRGFRSIREAFWSNDKNEPTETDVSPNHLISYIFVTTILLLFSALLYVLYCGRYGLDPIENFVNIAYHLRVVVGFLVFIVLMIALVLDLRNKQIQRMSQKK